MSSVSLPSRDSVAAQRELFRLAEKECALSIAAIAARTPIPVSTLKGWREGAAMPAWALGQLGAAGVPDHLLSLVLEPFGRSVVTDDDSDGDIDTAADDAGQLAASVRRARHPQSPGGVKIVPQEVAAIVPLARKVASSARKVAA